MRTFACVFHERIGDIDVSGLRFTLRNISKTMRHLLYTAGILSPQICLSQSLASWGNEHDAVLLLVLILVLVVAVPLGLITFIILKIAPTDPLELERRSHLAKNVVGDALLAFQQGKVISVRCPSCKNYVTLLDNKSRQVSTSCPCGLCNGHYSVISQNESAKS